MELHFLGGARTVTGSQFLVATERARVLVDCGLFQGGPSEGVRNRVPFGFDPLTLDAVVVTHAHLDHCGLLPVLVREGYRGPIHATAGTVELTNLVLRDSGRLHEEFAKREERWERRHSDKAEADDRREAADYAAALALAREATAEGQHVPTTIAPADPTDAAAPTDDHEAALRASSAELAPDLDAPLYTEDDAVAVEPSLHALEYGIEREVASGIHATLLDAGHILGSAIIRLRVQEGERERIVVFTGDLGRPASPVLRDPSTIASADYVIIESTYGDRHHDPQDVAIAQLAEAIRATADRGGVLLVPSFAIGRTQELIWEVDRLLERGDIPGLPLYLDSPMARQATDIYRAHPAYYDAETARLLGHGATPLDYPHQVIVRTATESAAVRQAPRPYMVVASNGMLTGGRIVNHLRHLIDDPAAEILFVGYQGEGTLGRHLQDGARTVRIDGAIREVRCRTRTISGFSAHADQAELLAWLGHLAPPDRSDASGGRPRTVFLVHGDPAAQDALAPLVRHLGLEVAVPRWREVVNLE
jgi:metallo-beta-lactamase family protein